eukprot:4175510-Prymnesium_polylepis.2
MAQCAGRAPPTTRRPRQYPLRAPDTAPPLSRELASPPPHVACAPPAPLRYPSRRGGRPPSAAASRARTRAAPHRRPGTPVAHARAPPERCPW